MKKVFLGLMTAMMFAGHVYAVQPENSSSGPDLFLQGFATIEEDFLTNYRVLLLTAEFCLSPTGIKINKDYPGVLDNCNFVIDQFKKIKVQSLLADDIKRIYNYLPDKETFVQVNVGNSHGLKGKNEKLSNNAQIFWDEWEIALKTLHSRLSGDLTPDQQRFIDDLIQYTSECIKEIQEQVGPQNLYDVLHQGFD